MGKWGEYTPEELACFKAARMYAYLADTSYSKKKAKKSVQRHSTLMKEDEEYKARHKQRMANYYKRKSNPQREEKAKKKAEKLLQKQEQAKQKQLEKVRRAELKAAEVAAAAAAKAAAAAAVTQIPRIQEQTLPLYPDVSYTISFD